MTDSFEKAVVRSVKRIASEHFLVPEVEDTPRGSVVWVYKGLPLTPQQLAKGQERDPLYRVAVVKPDDPEVETSGA